MLNNLKWIAIGMFIGIILLFSTSLFKQEISQLKKTITEPVLYNNKTITVGRSFNNIGLDPAVTIDQESARVTVNIYETLVAYDQDTIVPSLAKFWTVSEDGLIWTFTLNENIFFHDGTPLNAEAIAFNFNRWMDETSPYHAGNFRYWNIVFGDSPSIIKSVQSLSNNIVEIKLNKPYAPFLSTLTMPAFGIASPEAIMKYNEGLRLKPVGTGPYVLKSWDENGEIVLEDNVNYWKERAKVKTIVFKSISTSEQRVEQLLSGDIQILDNLTSEEVDQLKNSSHIELIRRPLTNIGYLAMNQDNSFLSNKGVRLAITSAVKSNMSKTGQINGFCRQADTFVPPGIWGGNNAIRYRFIHPDTAKNFLRAYEPSEKVLRLLVMKEARPYFPDPDKTANLVKTALKEMGIEVVIIKQPWDVFMQTIQDGNYDLLLMGWIADVIDPDNFLHTFFSSENIDAGLISNYSHYKNDTVDDLLTRARQTTDQEFRLSLYREVQEIISDEVPMVPLVNTMTIVAVNTAISNFTPTATGLEPLNLLDYEMGPINEQ